MPLPSREPLLSVDVQDSSAIPTARERGWDLAYRGVLPKSLGATLCSLSIPDLDSLVQAETELYASLRQPGALHAELRQFSKRRAAALPAVRVVKCLLLGLRRIRFEYQARLTAWLSLCRAALPPPPPEVAAEQAGAPSRDALQAWLTTGSGLRSMQELRWALLPPRAAVARLQSAYPRSRLSADSLLAKLFENSGAVLQDSPSRASLHAAAVHLPTTNHVLLDLWRLRPSRAHDRAFPLPLVPQPQSRALCFLQLQPSLPWAMPLEPGSPCGIQLPRFRRHSVP